MNQPSRNLLLIFTRNPELGKVKTRLANEVGDTAALEIYKFLLDHTVKVTKDLAVTKQVHYSGKIEDRDIWDNQIFQKKQQKGEDLGARMQHAFEEGFVEGYQNIIIIGSDLYDIHREDLEAAFATLGENDIVIGPAVDGGYYLLGMKSPTPHIFKNKTWSTASVLQETLEDLSGEKVALLAPKNDVDLYQDIQHHKDFQQFLSHLKNE